MVNKAIETWHRALDTRDISILDDLIADDAVFHSPVVHTPQEGKQLVTWYLTGAFHVLFNESFHYVREVIDGNEAMLEFKCNIEGIEINGVDLITSSNDGQITDFKVLIRPLKAVNKLHEKMGEMLEQLASETAVS